MQKKYSRFLSVVLCAALFLVNLRYDVLADSTTSTTETEAAGQEESPEKSPEENSEGNPEENTEENPEEISEGSQEESPEKKSEEISEENPGKNEEDNAGSTEEISGENIENLIEDESDETDEITDNQPEEDSQQTSSDLEEKENSSDENHADYDLKDESGEEKSIPASEENVEDMASENSVSENEKTDEITQEYEDGLKVILEETLADKTFTLFNAEPNGEPPTGDDIINVDDNTYYKVKDEDAVFMEFSDGIVTGKVYTKYTKTEEGSFVEDETVLYLVRVGNDGKYKNSISNKYSGSYTDACEEYGNLEAVFGCKFEGFYVEPTPRPRPETEPKKEEKKSNSVLMGFVQNVLGMIFGRTFLDEEESQESGAKVSDSEESGAEVVSASSNVDAQMMGTGSQSGWAAIESSITPANIHSGTYTIWGSKTMDVPDTVMGRMNSESVTVANFELTPKTMFSMSPLMQNDGDVKLSLDARCWNDNIQYKDDAPSVPVAAILQNGGTVMSDVLTVKCSNKDVSREAVITCSKFSPNAKQVTLYVFNPTNKTLVPYKTLNYGKSTNVQFFVPCVSATYVIIEN